MCHTLHTQEYPWIKRNNSQNSSPSNLTGVFSDCLKDRIGNRLSTYFANRLIAAHAGINFEVDVSGCGDESVTKLLGDPLTMNITSTNSTASSWQNVCSSCIDDITYSIARFPHTCRKMNMTDAIPVIKQEFQLLAQKTLDNHPELEEEIDGVAIRLRLLDVLGGSGHREDYGILPFPAYLDLIPKDGISTIGLVTAPYEPESPSSIVAEGLQEFLSKHYPHVSISIRNSTEDTFPMIATRFIKARRAAICTSSTYCLFPTIGTEGIGFIIPSILWGKKHMNWVDRLDNVHGLKAPKIRFIPAKSLPHPVTKDSLASSLLLNITDADYKVSEYSDLNEE